LGFGLKHRIYKKTKQVKQKKCVYLRFGYNVSVFQCFKSFNILRFIPKSAFNDSTKKTTQMKKLILTALAVICFLSLAAQNFTLSDIVNGRFTPRDIRPKISAPDGLHFYQTDAENRAVIKFSFATGLPVDTLFDTRMARGVTFGTFEGFLVSPDENRVLLYRNREQIYRRSFRATYYYHDVRRNLVRRLTENSEKQMIPTFSPDSRFLAYVADNNIWMARFDFDTESQITTDGKPNYILNGVTDWVYEEDFGVTQLMEFSPDSRQLAFVRTDKSQVREFSFQLFNEQLYPDLYTLRYPKAGETNATVEVKVFDIEARTTRRMEIPLDADGYIPRIKFTPDPERLAVMTLNRNQNRFDMYFVNPRTTVARLILREESRYFIDYQWLNSIHFFSDRFTYISERSGFSQIYIYGMSGTLQRQVTSGDFDVTALLAIDPQSNTIFFEAADESPMRRNVFRVNADRGEPQRLSQQSGTNTAWFSENGRFFVNRWSNTTTPTVITLHDANGREIRVLEENLAVREAVAAARLPQREAITVMAADGITPLNGWIMRPPNFDPNRAHPLVMVQYSGPNSQMVLDRFRPDWFYALLNEGFIVACVDGRGTGARGEQFRKQTYLQLGIKESDDQIAAARQLGTRPYIDAARIGIWGWSYGGTVVLMSMSRGDVFSAGVAIAPVTDWRFYNTVYTERFMRTPQQNAQGFRDTSPIHLADRLHGNLLLVHGTADDNVHFQNTIEYARALIRADKHFDMFVFPDADHSIRGGNAREYLHRMVIRYFGRNL
jgi:dipeptidyl-peptidase-4